MLQSMVRYVLVLVFLVSTSIYAHHTALPEGMTEASATWLWGYYTIPATITRDSTPYWYSYPHTDVNKINTPTWTEVAAGHIRPGAKAPAALVMHGCSGLIRGPVAYRVFFMERGYAVFEPDSFARPGHTCDFETSFDKRMEELDYAYEMIRNLPWVDQDRVVLMGLSEGGRAVAFWDKPGFAAHIITMNNCSDGQPHAPAGTPVLAIVGERDEYFAGHSCKVTREVKGSRSVVIPDAPHGILEYLETEQAIEDFLDASSL